MNAQVDEILRYYEETAEAGRLFAGSGLLERARTEELIERYLPKPPEVILDVGGGPGVYAGWLASLGYEVHLLDPAPKHIEEARRYALAGVRLGDARALPCEDNLAGAVLLSGPLYHLTSRPDRLRALREALRALRPGGLLFGTVISRYASLLHSLVDGFADDEEFRPILRRDIEEGQHRNDTGRLRYFTTAVFHRPEEIREEISESGFCDIEIFGVEGPGWLAKDFEEMWRDARRRERLLELVRRVECDAPLLGCSIHLLGVGRKPL